VPRSTERFITTPGGGERGYIAIHHPIIRLFCIRSGFQRQARVLLLLLRYYLATSDSLATTSTNRLSSRAPHARFLLAAIHVSTTSRSRSPDRQSSASPRIDLKTFYYHVQPQPPYSAHGHKPPLAHRPRQSVRLQIRHPEFECERTFRGGPKPLRGGV
jgi:hypothetical protein